MAKATPTIVVGATPTFMELELIFEDFRGQKVTKRITLDGAATDNQIKAIVSGIDMISNAQIISAKLVSSKSITGMNSTAQNALERNLSEAMALTFAVADPINSAKTISRTILIPAMTAAIELTDGSVDITETHMAALLGTSGGDFGDGDLSSVLRYKDGGGTWHSVMYWLTSESHHVTLADEVDNS